MFHFIVTLTVFLGVVSLPLISLGKHSFSIGEGHHMVEKMKCGGHIRHRKETIGSSVGSDRVDMRKMPGMLRKHNFTGSHTEKEGNRAFIEHT